MFRLVCIVAFAGVVAGIAGYHFVLRRRLIYREKEKRNVYRFSFLERCIHAVAILSLIVLAITGFVSTAILGGPLSGWLWLVHYVAAPVFAVAVALIALIWSQDGRFERHDWRWALHVGGYLWRKEGLPAGRFNAGQKAFFWFVGLFSIIVIVSGVGRMFPVLDATGQIVLYEVHRYSALILVLAVVAHFYLGIFANPGTWWAMISGYVGDNWAKHHHPVWWERVDQESRRKG